MGAQLSTDGFAAVAEAVNDAIVAADAAGRIVYVNTAACGMFGREADELLGASLTVLMPDRFRAPHEAGFGRVVAGAPSTLIGSSAVALTGVRADGSEFPLELSLGSYAVGEERRFTGVIRDMSGAAGRMALAAARLAVIEVLAEAATLEEGMPKVLEALATSLGFSAGALWRIDPDDGVLRVAAQWESPEMEANVLAERNRTMTFAREEGMPGGVWASGEPVWVETYDESGFNRADAARATGLRTAVAVPFVAGAEVLGVFELLTAEPRERDEELLETLSALGAAIGHFFERKLAEEALEAAVTELRRSNDDLQQFAYIASHDLSEPLRTIGGFAQLLQRRYEGQLDERADEYIGFIVGGVDRLQRLIDALLTFSRAGSARRANARLDLAAIAEAALAALQGSVADAGGEVHIDPLPEAMGDAGMISQVLQNLLANALKFRREGVAPRVHVTGQAERRRRVRISVADNGIGIAPQDAERVFGMFERLHGPDDYEGTGIGLALCRRIVERHGGEISAGPGEAEGTIVSFTLPTS